MITEIGGERDGLTTFQVQYEKCALLSQPGEMENDTPPPGAGLSTAHTLPFPHSRPLSCLGGLRSLRGPVQPTGTMSLLRGHLPTCLTHELLLVVDSAVFLTGLHSYIDLLPFLQ